MREGAAERSGEVTVLAVGPGAGPDIVPPSELEALGKEGYLLRSRGRVLVVAGGRPRGTLYGVYSLLEDELGCRWFTPEVSRIPRRERLALRPLDRTFVPELEYRATDYPKSRDPDWAVRNKINGTQTDLDERRGGKVAYGPFAHTFAEILDPAEHFDEHPEYFSEIDGRRIRERTQLCLTKPDVRRIAIETVRRWMRERPEASIFSVSQSDWHNGCWCPDCSAVIEEEGSPAGLYLRFVNEIADAVRDEFPDKVISTLAYQYTRKPPRITVPRPNVAVRLCSIECCFSHPLIVGEHVDPVNAAFARDIRGWSRICDRLHNGLYAVYLVDGTTRYRDAVRRVLRGLGDGVAEHDWGSADEYADAIEGAIHLQNREPVPEAVRWIDSEMRDLWAKQRPDGVIEGWHGDGNVARTGILYALWKSRGVRVVPWREDVRCGAVRLGDGLRVLVRAGECWEGKLVFDRPRHRESMGLPLDYPRINQFPEWFVCETGTSYEVREAGSGTAAVHEGAVLRSGLPVTVPADGELRLAVEPRGGEG